MKQARVRDQTSVPPTCRGGTGGGGPAPPGPSQPCTPHFCAQLLRVLAWGSLGTAPMLSCHLGHPAVCSDCAHPSSCVDVDVPGGMPAHEDRVRRSQWGRCGFVGVSRVEETACLPGTAPPLSPAQPPGCLQAWVSQTPRQQAAVSSFSWARWLCQPVHAVSRVMVMGVRS